MKLYAKSVDLEKSKVAVSELPDKTACLEFFIKTENEEPLAYHDRLDGNITHTAIKLSKEAAEALALLLADYLGMLNEADKKELEQ